MRNTFHFTALVDFRNASLHACSTLGKNETVHDQRSCEARTKLIALVTPVVAVIIGMIVLHEELNWRLLAGGLCIISGIALIVLRKSNKRVWTSEPEPDPISNP